MVGRMVTVVTDWACRARIGHAGPVTEPAPRYYGAARILRPGDPVPAGASVTADPARALADAWQASASDGTDRTPFVYEVTGRDGTLVITRDVLISRQIARRAAELG
jgi:hypothetical protein